LEKHFACSLVDATKHESKPIAIATVKGAPHVNDHMKKWYKRVGGVCSHVLLEVGSGVVRHIACNTLEVRWFGGVSKKTMLE
jgi:hypothetical protein